VAPAGTDSAPGPGSAPTPVWEAYPPLALPEGPRQEEQQWRTRPHMRWCTEEREAEQQQARSPCSRVPEPQGRFLAHPCNHRGS